ncbi:MAG: GDSL-type esterase/lipase family protein [Pseudomonadota bacterium]
MKPVFCTALVLLLFIQACSDTAPLDYIPEQGVILAFGDSLTVGVGASNKDSYPSVLARLGQRTVINAGVSGEVTQEGLERLPLMMDKLRQYFDCSTLVQRSLMKSRRE